jgi:hypothetical protein
MSYISTYAIGARELGRKMVLPWANPVYDAFIAGAWMLYWTGKTLYWIPKPKIHLEYPSPNNRRLHNAEYAAVESDVENLYFWHGVMVPAFVVVRPDWITLKHIETEANAEVRRVMIDRFGKDRFIMESGAQLVHEDDFGKLYRKELAGDEALVMVKVVNSTPEPDGSFKDYWIRVPPFIKRAREGVAWTFGKEEMAYAPEIQT